MMGCILSPRNHISMPMLTSPSFVYDPSEFSLYDNSVPVINKILAESIRLQRKYGLWGASFVVSSLVARAVRAAGYKASVVLGHLRYNMTEGKALIAKVLVEDRGWLIDNTVYGDHISEIFVTIYNDLAEYDYFVYDTAMDTERVRQMAGLRLSRIDELFRQFAQTTHKSQIVPQPGHMQIYNYYRRMQKYTRRVKRRYTCLGFISSVVPCLHFAYAVSQHPTSASSITRSMSLL